ncbi:MAG: AAA family ATPase [Planctomycetaceae bacterium]|nr:AAA family ATPase [Planctomycetaceae bacterium]
MLQRLYVHNFRCLENFELNLKDLPSSLLIGKNGSGKSTVGNVLEIFQKIGRGTNRVSELVQRKDFAQGRTETPIRFELEVLLDGKLFKYVLALEIPEDFKEARILKEEAIVDGESIFIRENSELSYLHVDVYENAEERTLNVDWNLASLPIISFLPLLPLRDWLDQMIILAPIPCLMNGESQGGTLSPERDGSNFGDWFLEVLTQFPRAYTYIDDYLKLIMPDIEEFQNNPTGKDTKELIVKFQREKDNLNVSFEDLSDGEKCFFLCALIIAANKSYGPLFCFWDEPDNYLGLSEVGHFIVALRRAFSTENGGQFTATSHNPEAIRKFSVIILISFIEKVTWNQHESNC